MTGKKSAAILVDADDIPQNTLEVIHSALSSCCDVRVLRVFGNSSRLSDAGWTALSARLPLDFRMTPNNSPGKSSASLYIFRADNVLLTILLAVFLQELLPLLIGERFLEAREEAEGLRQAGHRHRGKMLLPCVQGIMRRLPEPF